MEVKRRSKIWPNKLALYVGEHGLGWRDSRGGWNRLRPPWVQATYSERYGEAKIFGLWGFRWVRYPE